MSAPQRTHTQSGHVTSLDGTRIGFTKSGTGPGLVLVQGAMADLHAYDTLAQTLAPSFTVYAMDRRGRGTSPKTYTPAHTLDRDVEDIDAVLAHTGANLVFGLSSGAVITLEAARTLHRVTAAALFEPPFYPHGISRTGIKRLNTEIEQGDQPSALLDALLVAQTAPTPLRILPRPLARALARIVLAVDDRRTPPRSTLRDLLPAVRYDFHDVQTADGTITRYRSLTKPVLLLSGTRSPAFLQEAARTLHTVIPEARHTVINRAGHDAPWNSGRPHAVATALTDFFTTTQPNTPDGTAT
ncbi:alpha/beta hydrolase [Streptomyces sp. NPDC049916]|uniref:alpha/beta fold hydrolase n=1 Tax=Streptomyces sp. NPDC049916 TaxID=3155156 RepID=UPI0034404B88